MSKQVALMSFSLGLTALALGAVSVIPMALAGALFTLFSFAGIAALVSNGNSGPSFSYTSRNRVIDPFPTTYSHPTARKVVVNHHTHTSSAPHPTVVKQTFVTTPRPVFNQPPAAVKVVVPPSQSYQVPISKSAKTVHFAPSNTVSHGVAQKVAVVSSEPHATKVVRSSGASQSSFLSAQVNTSSAPRVEKVVRRPETNAFITTTFEPTTSWKPASWRPTANQSGQSLGRTQIITGTDSVDVRADRGPIEGVKTIKRPM